MDDGPGWFADPEDEAQERYWNGSAWTDRVRPAGRSRSLRLPEHVPELQRALAAATADIDAVEDRLSTMFERTDGAGCRRARPRHRAEPHDDRDVFAEADTEAGRGQRERRRRRARGAGPYGCGGSLREGQDDEAFAELNAALASEEPERRGADEPEESGKPKRGLFRRHS